MWMQASAQATVIFGMKPAFGGSKTSCFALVYDSVDAAKKHEPKHRLITVRLYPLSLQSSSSLVSY